MIIRFKYNPDRELALSWDELNIGDVFYHIHTKDVCIKTSGKAYFTINDRTYHTRSKLLSEGGHYKNYLQVPCKIEVEL